MIETKSQFESERKFFTKILSKKNLQLITITTKKCTPMSFSLQNMIAVPILG